MPLGFTYKCGNNSDKKRKNRPQSYTAFLVDLLDPVSGFLS